MGRPRKLNNYIFVDNIVIGITSNTNKEFIIDLVYYELVKEYTWYENQEGYIESLYTIENGKRKRIFLHRLICGVVDDDWRKVQVDHIEGNRLDNRREKLRICTNGDNQINRLPRKDNKSGVTGVSFDTRDRIWKVSINYRGARVNLGRFKDKDTAIQKRKEAELYYYGEFSNYKEMEG